MDLVSRTAAVFLDRDGTLIRDIGYLCREEQLEILPRVPEAIRRLREGGFKVVVITNQSAVGRGRLAETDLLKIHHVLRERLAQDGAFLDGIYYCPHHPTEGIEAYKLECECRKPGTGLIFQASKELSIDPSISYIVGDQVIDVELAQRVGAQGVWICDPQKRSGKAAALNAHCVADVGEAAEWIIDNSDFLRKRRVQR
jgi:D-glycero-D-manno-heptose 1,7-bisphosphate phosphatase